MAVLSSKVINFFTYDTTGGTTVSRFDYAHDALGRRVSRVDTGAALDTYTAHGNPNATPNPAFDLYGYNARSEVTSSARYRGANPADTSKPLHGRQRTYTYDSIGNRTQADGSGYIANELNQYTSRTVPGTVPVIGDAPLDVDVYINGEPADRQGPHWHAPVAADNTQTAAYPEVETLGVFIPQDPDAPDEYAVSTNRVFIAKTPEMFTYDADGNMTSDGRFTYTWNGENRLVKAETRADLPPDVPRHRVTYAYDHQGRMVSKEIFDLSNNYKLETKNYVWDFWNIIAETTVSPSPIPNSSFLITNCTQYAWGLDLSGTLQVAGGVGGLLAAIRDDGTFAPAYDANGNVTEYVSLTTDHSPLITSPIAAHYEYDAFGNTVAQSGTMPSAFAFRFSTKYWEPETATLHYELSPYSPSLGRWLSKDPAGERGGWNLYGFVDNTPVIAFDYLGLTPVTQVKTPEREWYEFPPQMPPPVPYTTGLPPRTLLLPTTPATSPIQGLMGLPSLLIDILTSRKSSRNAMRDGLSSCEKYPRSVREPPSPYPVFTCPRKMRCCVMTIIREMIGHTTLYHFRSAYLADESCSDLKGAERAPLGSRSWMPITVYQDW